MHIAASIPSVAQARIAQELTLQQGSSQVFSAGKLKVEECLENPARIAPPSSYCSPPVATSVLRRLMIQYRSSCRPL